MCIAVVVINRSDYPSLPSILLYIYCQVWRETRRFVPPWKFMSPEGEAQPLPKWKVCGKLAANLPQTCSTLFSAPEKLRNSVQKCAASGTLPAHNRLRATESKVVRQNWNCVREAQTEKKSNAILIKYQCNTNKILKSTALEYFISVALNAILMQYYRAIYRLVLHWYCIETYYVRSILLVLHLSDKLQIVLHCIWKYCIKYCIRLWFLKTLLIVLH